MIKFRNAKPALWLIVVVVVGLSALPIQAAIKQNFPTQETLNSSDRQLFALSWGEIWDKLRRKRGKRGSRGDDNKEFFCMIAPGKLEDQNNGKQSLVVWSTQPVFLWRGQMVGIEVRHIRSDELMWRQTFSPTTRSIIYQGKPLQPGEDYFWRETIPLDQLPSKRSFRMMDAKERDRISTELKELESERKAKGSREEEIVLSRVNYFAKNDLWSDVLREIYSVPNPSPELKEKIKQIQGHDFCSQEKDEQKLGLVLWK
ncbi:hypothetical protein NUACC21_55200 [Scytonema sp. NUACC21]